MRAPYLRATLRSAAFRSRSLRSFRPRPALTSQLLLLCRVVLRSGPSHSRWSGSALRSPPQPKPQKPQKPPDTALTQAHRAAGHGAGSLLLPPPNLPAAGARAAPAHPPPDASLPHHAATPPGLPAHNHPTPGSASAPARTHRPGASCRQPPALVPAARQPAPLPTARIWCLRRCVHWGRPPRPPTTMPRLTPGHLPRALPHQPPALPS